MSNSKSAISVIRLYDYRSIVKFFEGAEKLQVHRLKGSGFRVRIENRKTAEYRTAECRRKEGFALLNHFFNWIECLTCPPLEDSTFIIPNSILVFSQLLNLELLNPEPVIRKPSRVCKHTA